MITVIPLFLTCFSRDFPFHLFQTFNSTLCCYRSPWSWSHLSNLWSVLPWHLCLSEVWACRLNDWLESFISISILPPLLRHHGEPTLLLRLNLGLAMRLVLANGMSAEVMQAEACTLHVWLGLPSATHVSATKRMCASSPPSIPFWGEWVGQPWTQLALGVKPDQTQLTLADPSWPTHVHVMAVLSYWVCSVLSHSIVINAGCYCRQCQDIQEKRQEKIARRNKLSSTSALFFSLAGWFYH